MEKRENPQQKLQKSKPLFFQIGLVTALAVVLIAFEWMTFNPHQMQFDSSNEMDNYEEDMIPITMRKTFIKEPPKPFTLPQEPNEVIIEALQFDDTPELEPDFLDEFEPIPFYVSHYDEYDDFEDPLIFIDEMPSYPGGDEGLMKHLQSHIRYTSKARIDGVSGRVLITFIVEKDGSVSNIEVQQSLHPDLDNIAIEAIKKMAKWNPGKNAMGMPVRVRKSAPIHFILKG
jgi:protein TonB